MARRKTVKGHYGQQGTCVNINCDEPRQTIIISDNGIPTYRPDCNNCHFADIGYINPQSGKKYVYAKGVIRVKKNHCQNKFGTAQKCKGIECRTEHNTDGTLPSKMLDRDHIDGNHNNNIPDNIQTLCKSCHAEKTKLNSDYKSQGGNQHFGFDKDAKQSVLIEPPVPIDHDFFKI